MDLDLDDIDFNVSKPDKEPVPAEQIDSDEDEFEYEYNELVHNVVNSNHQKELETQGVNPEEEDEFDSVWKEVEATEHSDEFIKPPVQQQQQQPVSDIATPPSRKIVVQSPSETNVVIQQKQSSTQNRSIISELISNTNNALAQQQQIQANKEDNNKSVDDELQRVQDEWNNLTKFREEQSSTRPTKESGRRDVPISYKDALAYFTSSEATSNNAETVRKELRRPAYSIGTKATIALQKITFYSCGRPILKNAKLQDELELIFCIAKIGLDHSNEEHERILVTIYRNLSGDRLSCPSVGSHWDMIGFQGGDPKTDLRATGMFSMLQLLAFFNKCFSLPLEIFTLSKNPDQMFPFAVTSINMTGMVLQCLRDGTLTKIANSTGSLIETANDLYMGLFLKFYQLWKRENRNIMRFDETKKYLQEHVKKHSKHLIKDFDQYMSSKKLVKSQAMVTNFDSR